MEDTFIATSPGGTVYINDDKTLFFSIETTEDDVQQWLANNQLLKAACSYAGINRPMLKKELQYQFGGTIAIVCFYIYQQGESEIETLCNAGLQVISLSCVEV